jgi:hypothetical protein
MKMKKKEPILSVSIKSFMVKKEIMMIRLVNAAIGIHHAYWLWTETTMR